MKKINLVWLKRDLRLTDHAPLNAALRSGTPTLIFYVFEPWKMSAMEALMYSIEPDSIYLNPIINLDTASREARDRLWSWKKRKDVALEAKRILSIHVRSD
ncbi:deoxyribodipyrimidine photo-lyase [Vibrio neptunius]|uniref:deoxyribodipyrimidine photo-lyase n=1 Tax=Vibrio neptunius TaxID=170651 RepID=UPI0019D2D4AA|nr:deoxyribodipyrimidine photo-lyase [Vibrio neptunius]MBN3574171.1 deoxyribodipyrimidine photo-lyase [Vibrio neptunius]